MDKVIFLNVHVCKPRTLNDNTEYEWPYIVSYRNLQLFHHMMIYRPIHQNRCSDLSGINEIPY